MVDGQSSGIAQSAGRIGGTSARGQAPGSIDGVLLLYGLLLLWNSLIPFQLHFESAAALGTARFLGLPVCGLTYPDALSNIVAYVPLGALLARRFWLRTGSLLLGTVLAMVLSAGLSYGVEYLQQYTATRISSVGDLMCNLSGAAVGSLCAPLVFGLLRRARKGWVRELQVSPLASLTKLYAGILVIIALVPWTFTMDRRLVLNHYRAAQVQSAAVARALVAQPAYADYQAYGEAATRRRAAMETVMRGIYELLTFAVLAALVSRILQSDLGFRSGPRMLLTIWLVGGLATTVALLQLFVRFGSGSFLMYASRLYGCALGLVVYRWIPAGWTRRDLLRRWVGAGFPVPDGLRFPLIPCALFVVLFMGWVPFFFSVSGPGPSVVNAPMLLPFYHYFQAKAPIAYEDFFFKLIRFGALGFVLSLAWGPGAEQRRFRRVLVAGFWCAAVAGLIEVVQFFIPTRHPDLTDVLLGFVGGAGGVVLHLRSLGYLRSLSRATGPFGHAPRGAPPASARLHGCT